MLTKFEVCSLVIPERQTKLHNLKMGQCDLDYILL